MSRRKIEVRQDLTGPAPFPLRRPDPKMSRRFEKTSFASNAPGILHGQAKDHDWYARDPDDAIRKPTRAFGHHVPKPNRLTKAQTLRPSPHRPIRSRPNALPLHNVKVPDAHAFKARGQVFKTAGPAWDLRPPRRSPPKSPLRALPAQSETDELHRILSSDLVERRNSLPKAGPMNPRPPEPKAPWTLVEPDGIEPTTSCLQSTRSPN